MISCSGKRQARYGWAKDQRRDVDDWLDAGPRIFGPLWAMKSV